MKNALVVKSNDLIQARYELNLLEQKIILYAVTMLDREQDRFNVISISVGDFIKLIDTSKERYSEIREIVSKLMSKQVRIKSEGKDLLANWVSSIEYIEGEGTIELEFSVKLVPYLLQLKSKFTRYQLKNILHLKNKYSIRLYELLKQFEGIKRREFSTEELRDLLMISDKYPAFRDLNKYVIKPTVDEINEFTDLDVSVEYSKRGRKVIGVVYKIDCGECRYIDYLENTYPIGEFKKKSGLESENWSSKQIVDLYSIACDKTVAHNLDIFQYIRLNYEHTLRTKSVRNRYAYLKKALDEDYGKAFVQLSTGYLVDWEK